MKRATQLKRDAALNYLYSLWDAGMPIRCQLILVRHIQHARLVEIIADNLQANWHSIGAEAAGNGHAG